MNTRDTILIIEDEQINRKKLNKLLQNDYDIKEACNGQDGLNILLNNRSKIVAVLLDVLMPVMNGYEFLEEVRKNGMKNIPIIVTTGTYDAKSEQTVLAAGAWDFVLKPYNGPVLLTRLKNAIARSQVALYEQMQRMVAHDQLTGLHNRGRMFERTRQMIDEHPDTPFVFLRFDIDHFALFNTSFGENEGDKLLIYLAKCLSELSATVDLCTYCRMNSDIFCACFNYDNDESNLRQIIDGLQQKLSAYKKDYLLKISVGACVVNDKSLSVDELYFRANVASRRCKDRYDKNVAFYDAAAGEKIAKDLEITNEMQAALDDNQFVVYLQPKFNVSTESVCGAEALVRWMHPSKGLIMPGEFIPVFENNGFITKLDYYVWRQTCSILHKWIEDGVTPYPISVNVSRISLYNPNIVKLLDSLVNEFEISHALLQLEITESAYMTNPELMEATIKSFHDAGFTVLMDDFGSGYSSLNTLKRIYIDILKIDMKFLPIGNETERGEIILACIIKMSNLLGISVVTEGVETQRQRDFLEGAGCDNIQGYYYSRALAQEEFEKKYLYKDSLDENNYKEEAINKSSHKNNTTILVIDDSEEECVILYENLKDLYNVHVCDSAEAGLAYLKNNMTRVKLILLDNIMPGMTGIQFLKYSKLDKELSAIPKIMITANNNTEDQIEAFKAGAYDFIAKPLTKEVLLARVSHIMAVSREAVTFEEIENEYNRYAEHDSLTGLLGKLAFRELVSQMLQMAPKDDYALMVIDVDDFKKVNDDYGHLAGDELLKCVAVQLSNLLRKVDVIGRFGGDEFVVLMTRIPNRDVAKKKAAEIIKSIVFASANQLNIDTSISVGIAFTNGNDSEEALFARADQALYEAKKTGKAKAIVYGEKVPPIQDNDKPVVLICSDDPQLYPSIALSYGETAAFANITNYDELVLAFTKYQKRICLVCIDMQKSIVSNSDKFYLYIVEHGGGDIIPMIAFCNEGNVHQMKDALKLNIIDLITMPPHIDIIQHRLAAAITRGMLSIGCIDKHIESNKAIENKR